MAQRAEWAGGNPRNAGGTGRRGRAAAGRGDADGQGVWGGAQRVSRDASCFASGAAGGLRQPVGDWLAETHGEIRSIRDFEGLLPRAAEAGAVDRYREPGCFAASVQAGSGAGPVFDTEGTRRAPVGIREEWRAPGAGATVRIEGRV